MAVPVNIVILNSLRGASSRSQTVGPHSPVIAAQWMLKHAQDDDRGAM
tara:strand:- start:2268 stop:2411 length:144 start_codon:yes stop_codon:yes gene_type:complete